MDKNQCSFQQLPFSHLFNTYVTNFEALSDFYSVNPFKDEEVEARANRIGAYPSREVFISALESYHDVLGIKDAQQLQLSKFSNPEALVIVTGQQLGMYGGPLFTIYKTMSTILLARKWEKKLNRPVVPVFWLADEDHDFEEIASIGIPGFDALTKVKLSEEGNGKPVSDQLVGNSIADFKTDLKEVLHETEFSNDLWTQLNNAYKEGKSHVQAFAQLMSEWFSETGLLIVGSNFEAIKQLSSEVFTTAIEKADSIENALESQSSKLEEEYQRQVVVSSSNLFYLDDAKGRQKIELTDSGWSILGAEYSIEKILSIVEEHPSKFSPNVFLRPLLQDFLLPTIGYVAGPGELAYYGQMKELYPQFGLEMPVIFPRLSVTLLETGIARILDKLPFQMCNYNQRIEDLEAQYVELTNSKDIDGVFSAWNNQMKESAEAPISLIKEIDPTLEGAAGKTLAGFENELNKLKGRLFRSIKQQEETQIKRISKIKSQLFPDGLQERSVSPVYFMNKYGVDIWGTLMESFQEDDLDLRIHHVITL